MVHTAPKQVGEVKSMYVKKKYCARSWCKCKAFTKNECTEWKLQTKLYGITSIYQQTNAHIISHKTFLKHFKTLRHVSIVSDHHQGALFLAKVMLQYSQFSWYLQTRCCSSISCCVGMCCGAATSHCSTTHSTKMHGATIRFINYMDLNSLWKNILNL